MVILDAAHNELAARVLTDALVKDFRASTRPVVMVIGMSHRHEPQELLQALLTNIHPKLLIATQPSFRPRPAEEIMNAARLLGVEHTEAVIDVPDAANRAIDAARAIDDSLVLITGSFFTIGDLPQAMWNNVPLQAETVS
jgi:folylpolyglutamate synthase/dihydropteroate synthase